MVEIRVEVVEAAGAGGLLQSLPELLGQSSVSFDEARRELSVRSEWEPGKLDRIIDEFELWLATDGVGSSAKLWIGEASYTLVGSAVREGSE